MFIGINRDPWPNMGEYKDLLEHAHWKYLSHMTKETTKGNGPTLATPSLTKLSATRRGNSQTMEARGLTGVGMLII